ncbi:MAG: hypothetical protein ACOY94_18510 [Bacillota bacterium]
MRELLTGLFCVVVGILAIKFRHQFQYNPRDGSRVEPNSRFDRWVVAITGTCFILAGVYIIGHRFFGLPEL